MVAAALMPSHRAARFVTAIGAVTGCAGGLTAAATVLMTGQPAPIIFPEKGKIHLQYTTTSPKLHKVLGVETPVFD